jgi:hypothetical protein
MTDFVFNVTEFRVNYPQFENPLEFPDYYLQEWWNNATCYVDPTDNTCGVLQGDCRYLALNLMTAHLAALSVIVKNGQVPGLAQSATIDKITVSLTPPPLPNQYRWWLSLTPYGQRLLALLQARSVGGYFIGGLPETTAIRHWGGL